ncbi:rho GTPase activating protein 22 [Mycena olivaceomarginata]|nr:rho GTPase activating protein 22 [Mycena olivaceomarginata]
MPKPSLQPPTPAPAPPTPSRAPLAQFLTRPSKWFARSASAPRVSGLAAAGNEISPRASTSSVANGPSGARKPKILAPDGPTANFGCGGLYGSVLDLSRPSLSLSPSASTPGSHAKSSLDLRYAVPPSPARSAHNVYGGGGGGVYGNGIYGGGAGAGDLRTTSRRAWAHSADDLRTLVNSPLPPIPPVPSSPTTSTSPPSATRERDREPEKEREQPGHLRVNTSVAFVDKVAAYRSRSDSTPLSETDTPHGYGQPPSGYTPSTATATTPSYTHHSSNSVGNILGSYTGAPLVSPPGSFAPSTSPPKSNSAYPPLYLADAPHSDARRRAGAVLCASSDGLGTEREEREEAGGARARSGGGMGGMAWPAIGGAGAGGANGRGDGTNGMGGGGSPVSISISAPVLAGAGAGGGADGSGYGFGGASGGLMGVQGAGGIAPGHVHTRSHSFTPKLSSRLANLGGASPGRKGSADQVDLAVERDGRDGKEKEKRGVGFPFHFGGAQSKPLPPDPASLAPPHIILEPAPEEEDASSKTTNTTLRPASTMVDIATAEGKRASQIVYASGFVNRLITPALADPRAWKPFKMEVRGQKLILHKPPSDRAAGVRDLFAVGVVEEPEKEEETDTLAIEDAGGGQRRDAGINGRKKRAYWGRGRHPGLGVAGAGAAAPGGVFGAEEGKAGPKGRIEKGTMEALVHELVFATVFLRADAVDEEAARCEEEWRDYALAVLFSLPLLAGRARVETEFVRCAGYLVSGAGPDEMEKQRARVAWMAGEYLRFHGAPADGDAWESFRAETIPDVFPAMPTVPSGMPASASTQAMHVPTPMGSPALSSTPFSPRPDGSGRMVGLLDALGVRDPIVPASPAVASLSAPRSPQPQRGGLSSRMPWAALQTDGLTREVLLALDPHVIARSLTLFHRAVLEQAPDNPTAAFVDPAADGASSPFFGSDATPQWLTKLLLMQILGPDTGSGAAQHGGGEQKKQLRPFVSHAFKKRGHLRMGAGRGPLSLDKVWRRVESQALAAVEGWAQSEGEGCEVGEARITPWGGDIQRRVKEEIESARPSEAGGAEESLLVAPMERALDIFERFRQQFLLCPRRVSLAEDEVGEDVKLLVDYWREKFAEGPDGGGYRGQVCPFMSLSLAAEARRKGLFEPHYWTRAANQTPFASLVPLVFPEPLPSSSLIDRAQLLHGDPRLLRIDPQRLDPHHSTHQPRRDIGGLTIPVYGGELLLSVSHDTDDDASAKGSRPSSRLPSRPPSSVVPDSVEVGISRAPSVRVKPGSSHGLDRKTSVLRRNSLPSPAQRRTFVASEPSSEPPLRVRVLAGTLHWLVNILVHGLQNISVSVADDQGEMSLREGKTRELVVDQLEFSKLWWNVYRSLVSPLVFFELLRKMYMQTRPRGTVPTVAELLYVAGSRTEVLDALQDWLTRGGGAQDMLDDPQLYTAVCSFLDTPTDHAMPPSANASDPGVEQAWSTLTEVRGRLRRTFETNTMRPPAPFPSLSRHTTSAMNGRSRPQNQSRDPPNIDTVDPEELVDAIDAMASAAFGNITEEARVSSPSAFLSNLSQDLFITSDLLEVQGADRIGWFLSFSPSEETVEIQNIYSYLQDVEPSSLIPELGQDSLYRLLPPSIRSCIRAYVILRKWTVAQIVAPRLGLHARQSRMELVLRAIEVTRLRAAPKYASSPHAVVDFTCPRSFAEAVLTSAVLSVESRLHNRPWLNIAMNRGVHCDSIGSLLSQPATQALSSSRELTVDIGWFLERMLEILSAPDVMESLVQQEGHSLINFDKRRHLCNLIVSVRKGSSRDGRAFERLNQIEQQVWLLQFDHRGIKEEAQREGSSGPGSSPAAARRAVRPFQKTIALQVEKNRRDRTLRTRIHKERVQEQTKNDKREDLLNKAMRRQPATPQQKHQRSKKSMSAFLHFMRPISSAFTGNETVHAPAVKRTAEELDFAPSGKPSLVVGLVEARVAQFINNDRSFTFQLDTEDGGHYLFQARNGKEMANWLQTINRVTQTAAKRRLTYLGNPKPQLADHLHDPVAASREPLAVFGVDLNFLLRREFGSDDIPPGTIPSVIERCLTEIETRGLTEVGIYRLAGAASTITALKEAFNRGEDPIDSSTDIHAVCDLVKSWFRVLPEPLFPSDAYHAAVAAMKLENLDERLTSTRNVVQRLPRPNFDLLKRVTEHLDRVADFEEVNQMHAEGLAIVFSPNLLRAPQENFAMILTNMAHTHRLVKTLITHFPVIFDENDAGDLEENEEPEEEEEVEVEVEAEEPFRSNSPNHLEEVAEDDGENDQSEEEEDEQPDLPPTITATVDHSPLDFSTFTYTLPT